ncbi:IcfA [Haloarcula sp. S1CR25-12]|uniref:carbonic anhydrase n=1 Tax=Haloarcula saliterrae TaxID=2950534 RepID=A0ABU2FB02_9EURY|nr:carbonic anhydrase [Haloarcula sp. S1CR25-12]MDS0258890.1 IcfA [Haloarcula sp. S1CR25-12]
MDSTVVELLDRNVEHAEKENARFDDLQETQFPDAVTICCSDSRVLQDDMWGNDEPGKIFTCSNIGNRVTQPTSMGHLVSGDVMFPLWNTDTKVAIVVGHTGCGAVTTAFQYLTEDVIQPRGIKYCLEQLKPHLKEALDVLPDDLSDAAAINHLVEYNVDHQVSRLVDSEDVPDDVTVLGVVYDFQDVYSDQRGKVHVINVAGETDVATLRGDHPEIADRIGRLWEYGRTLTAEQT